MPCEEILRKIKKKGAKGEIFDHIRKSINVKFEFNKLTSIKGNSNFGRALRVINNGRIGFSTTTDESDTRKLPDMALESSNFGREALFDFPNKNCIFQTETYFEETKNISLVKLVDNAKEIIHTILDYEPSAVINIDLGIEENEFKIFNSSGFHNTTKKTEYYISLELQRIEKNDILEISEFKNSLKPDIDLKQISQSLIKKLKYSKNIVKPSKREIPVIFSPSGNLAIILPIIAGLNGDNVHKKISPLDIDKIGTKLFDSKLTLKDSGIIANLPKSSPYDDEGIPRLEYNLIEKGVLKNFYLDLQSSMSLSLNPTGNGLKVSSLLGGFNIASPPYPNVNNLIVEGGEINLKKLLAQSNEALIVDSVLGLGQGNIIAGDFSNNVLLGFLAKDGEITGRVKDAMIFGNAYTVLKNDISLCKEREWTYGFISSPWTQISGISVVF